MNSFLYFLQKCITFELRQARDGAPCALQPGQPEDGRGRRWAQGLGVPRRRAALPKEAGPAAGTDPRGAPRHRSHRPFLPRVRGLRLDSTTSAVRLARESAFLTPRFFTCKFGVFGITVTPTSRECCEIKASP